MDVPLLSAFAKIVRLRRLQGTRTRQHGVGVCDGGPVECVVACSFGEDNEAALRRLQCARARKHGVGVCDGDPVGCATACKLGDYCGKPIRRLLSALVRHHVMAYDTAALSDVALFVNDSVKLL